MMHTKNTGTVFARRATRRKRILLLQLADFNPHPHTEDDYSTMCLSLFPALLQSTSSHGGWRKGIKTIDKGGTLQSTSSHRGWHAYLSQYRTVQATSIHTLTWRVTNTLFPSEEKKEISIHTLTWRVTVLYCQFKSFITISIHTLTWRVTPPCTAFS